MIFFHSCVPIMFSACSQCVPQGVLNSTSSYVISPGGWFSRVVERRPLAILTKITWIANGAKHVPFHIQTGGYMNEGRLKGLTHTSLHYIFN